MNKKVILIAAASMVVAGAVFVALGVNGGATPVIMIGNKNVEDYNSSKDNGTIDISDFDTLTINADSVDVRIIEGDEYKLEYYVNKEKIPEVSQDGKHLTINQPAVKHTLFFFSWEYAIGFHEESNYTITVPKDAAPLNVDIKNDDDDIIIDGVDVNGSIVSDCDDVELDNVSSSDLSVKTSDGEIRLNNSEFDKLTLENSDEEMFAKKCTINNLDAKSSSDAITLNDVRINTANLEAGNDIRIDIVGPNDYSFDLVSDDGEDVVVGENRMEGSFKVDNGSGKSITARSDSGEVRVSFSGE